MNAVGIDVPKSKSIVAIMHPFGEIIASLFEVKHTTSDIKSLVKFINSVEGNPVLSWGRPDVIMKSLLINFPRPTHSSAPSTQSLSRILTMIPFVRLSPIKRMPSKSPNMHLTSGKIKQYSVMDELRNQLKTMNRQFGFCTKHQTAMKNNLIGILDQTYPGVNFYFDSPARDNGSQK